VNREEQIANMKKNTAQFHKLIIPVVTGLPADLKIVFHLCRANGGTHFNVPYTYHDLIPIFGKVNPPPAYLLLEWDDERAGSVEVLKEFDAALPTTNFFLGFVTTKNSVVENEEEITFEKIYVLFSFSLI
jgi:methionine synthase II (cobalamin-independent)